MDPSNVFGRARATLIGQNRCGCRFPISSYPIRAHRVPALEPRGPSSTTPELDGGFILEGWDAHRFSRRQADPLECSG